MEHQEKRKDKDLLLEKLRKDDSFYNDILSTQIDWIWEVNNKGIYTYCSEGVKDFLGYTPDEIMEKNPFDLMPPEEATRVSAIYTKIIERQDPIINFENWNLHKNGKLGCLLTNGIPFYDKNGNWLGYRGIAKDITEYKKMEKNLRKSEEMFRAVFETAKDCVFIKNRSLQYIQVNPAMEEMFGVPAEELKNKTDIDLFGKEAGKHVMEVDKRVLNGEIIEEEPTKPIHGIPHTFHTIKVPLKDSNGNIFGLCGIARDITERKKVEESVKESEEKYRLISENANDLIVIVNQKFEIEYMNDPIYRKRKLTGYARDEAIGKSVTEFIYPDDVKRAIEAFKKGLKIGEGMEEIRFKQKDGNWNWLEIRGRAFIDNKGEKKALFIARDITERKKAEQKLIESEEKYREAYNLADFYKDLFAHDMNNILQNILSSAALCELYLYEPEKLKDMSNLLKILKDQVKRGANLISNVQKLSQLEETQIITQSTEVYIVLQKVIKFIQNSVQEKKLKIEIKIPWKKIHIFANDLLIDVFENILLNAVKYNENPIVEINIKFSKIHQEGIKYLKIEFKDNGIGIQDFNKEIIFQRGYKKDISIKGMGFGLSLVKKILEGYNGKIWVEDKIQGDYTKGSNFVILIPEAA